jgi:hypothetical protein
MTVKGWRRIADGIELCPEPYQDENGEEDLNYEDILYLKRERDEELTQFLILTNETKVYLENVDGKGHEHWKALTEEFESKTVANKLRLRCSLYGWNIRQVCFRYSKYSCAIKSSKYLISNNEKVAVFILGLPSSFDSVTQTYLWRQKSNSIQQFVR